MTHTTSAASGKDKVSNTSAAQDAHLYAPQPATPTSTDNSIPARSHYYTRGSTRSPEERRQIEQDHRLAVEAQKQAFRGRETDEGMQAVPCSNSSTSSSQTLPNPTRAAAVPDASTKPPTIEQIANHGHLFSSVPYSSRSKFQYRCGILLEKYSAAAQTNDKEGMISAIAQLMQVPDEMLNKHIHLRGRQSSTANRTSEQPENQITATTDAPVSQNLSDEFSEAKATEDEKIEPVLGNTAAQDVAEEEKKIIRKALALIRSKHIGRAAHVLSRPKQLHNNRMNTAQLLHKLKQLHHHPQEGRSHVPMPEHFTGNPIDLRDPAQEKSFRQMIQNMANGSAPGLSGWTGDMLKVIYDDSSCRKGLAHLISDICNGGLPDEVKEYILPSHLVPVPKPNQSIRPISMGEIFYRAAAHYAVNSVSHVIADVLGPIQFGVGKPAGCEQAVHRLQHLLTRTYPHRLAGIAVDFKNAFNERNRSDILQELYKYDELRPIWNIVRWAYSDPSALWIRDMESRRMFTPDEGLTSAEGVRQGDPLGALLFALSMKSIYDKAVQSDESGSVSAIAFLDDCTLIGLPDKRLIRVFEVLKEAAKEGGLEVNISKTKFLWLHEAECALPIAIEHKLAHMSMLIERGATMLLGAPIGTDTEKMQSLLMKIVRDHEPFFQRINSTLLPIQEALILLRVCALPRLNYLARTTPARILYPAAEAFDRLMYTSFNSKLSLNPPIHTTSETSSTTGGSNSNSHSSSSSSSLTTHDPALHRARLQLALPIRLSGLGLRSTVDTMSFAYIASYVRVVYEDQDWWKNNAPTEENNLTFTARLDEVIELVHAKLPGSKHKHLYPLDTDILHFLKQTEGMMRGDRNTSRRHGPPNQSMIQKLQAVLGDAYSKVRLFDLVKLCGQQEDYDRIACLNQPGNESHHWLQVLPSDRSSTMNDPTMRQAVLYRLGLNPYDKVVPATCLCGKKDVFHGDPYHSLSCSALRYYGTNRRHNLLVRNMTNWIRRAGAIVQTEVTGMSSENNKRPDIVFWYDQKQYVIDVTVTDPFNATNTKRVGPVTLVRQRHNQRLYFDSRAAQYNLIHAAMEKRKNKHYEELVENSRSFCDTQFFTAGAFTTGGLCDEFRELISVISMIAQRETSGWDPGEVVDGIRGSIAVAIQEGNAWILNDSWNRIAHRNFNLLLRPEREGGRARGHRFRIDLERSTTPIPLVA